MRFALVCLALVPVLSGCGDGEKPEPSNRYTVTAHPNVVLMVDVQTGQTWRLGPDGGDGLRWDPLPGPPK